MNGTRIPPASIRRVDTETQIDGLGISHSKRTVARAAGGAGVHVCLPGWGPVAGPGAWRGSGMVTHWSRRLDIGHGDLSRSQRGLYQSESFAPGPPGRATGDMCDLPATLDCLTSRKPGPAGGTTSVVLPGGRQCRCEHGAAAVSGRSPQAGFVHATYAVLRKART